MTFKDWSTRQKLRLQMAKLGQDLTALKTEFDLVASVSSRMVANRIQHASSDYWKAVDAYSRDSLDETRALVKVGLLETAFIRKLMDAETAERELGESIFFEYADKSDAESSLSRIEASLATIWVELNLFLLDCKKGKQP